MPIPASSDSDGNDEHIPRQRLFGRQRPLHALLGAGKVADVLLWRDKTLSAALLVGVTTIWFLFEVVEYSLVTLLCHISITSMLVLFIWTSTAQYFHLPPPQVPDMLLRESVFQEFMSTLHRRLKIFVNKTLGIAYGRDPLLFIFVTITLYILSVIGSYLSFINLLFFGFVFAETVPFLYERYENEVDYLATILGRDMKRIYKRLDSRVLGKIPRGPVKDKHK